MSKTSNEGEKKKLKMMAKFNRAQISLRNEKYEEKAFNEFNEIYDFFS
jgi:hypothetical protein